MPRGVLGVIRGRRGTGGSSKIKSYSTYEDTSSTPMPLHQKIILTLLILGMLAGVIVISVTGDKFTNKKDKDDKKKDKAGKRKDKDDKRK